MSPVVLDASSALTWCFEDEASEAGDRLFCRVQDRGAVVPPLWHLEIAHIVLSAERRRRLTQTEVESYLDLLRQLRIDTDAAPPERARADTLRLAREHRLSVYDACYLDLAMRRRLPLATRDTALQRAARAVGVELIEL
ncbi:MULTISPECIES: type II toxin-antitoxin system VapC family toxin [Caldimonas]|jgi:predicted nucleic acid-binding protein|uniref:type II toxin-antitoxin system VapC family toxin n=1 Tax=Caldimonas TaxID=196013 RepID=UPI00036C12ED|nr:MULTISPECIES: type II toxin-antitoxin system VapC family toxin [Caldimonas]GIX24602.1 MAG: twitching motility protein PilT [Caldimonas sp.]